MLYHSDMPDAISIVQKGFDPAANENLTTASPEQLVREHISGGYESMIVAVTADLLRVLTMAFDDLTREFGDKVYDQMQTDPVVYACVEMLKLMGLSEPLTWSSACDEESDPDYALAQEIAESMERWFGNMATPLQQVSYDMLEAIVYGSATAEVNYEMYDDPVLLRPVYKLRSIKTKSRRKFAYVVDRGMNVLGVVNREFPSGTAAVTGFIPGTIRADEIVPRQKLMMLTFHPRYGDPRGRSLIRPAYNAYYVKTQVWPAYLKFLVQFGTPSLFGTTAEGDSEPLIQRDANGSVIMENGAPKTITPQQVFLKEIIKFQNGSALVGKFGSKLDVISSKENGAAFDLAMSILDKQIATSILGSSRTLLEAKHSSKADAESGADITSMFVDFIRDGLCASYKSDVAYWLTYLNYGKDIADRLTPIPTLAGADKQDFAKAASGVAALMTAGFIADDQLTDFDALLNIRERDMEAWNAKKEEQRQQELAQSKLRDKLSYPAETA